MAWVGNMVVGVAAAKQPPHTVDEGDERMGEGWTAAWRQGGSGRPRGNISPAVMGPAAGGASAAVAMHCLCRTSCQLLPSRTIGSVHCLHQLAAHAGRPLPLRLHLRLRIFQAAGGSTAGSCSSTRRSTSLPRHQPGCCTNSNTMFLLVNCCFLS